MIQISWNTKEKRKEERERERQKEAREEKKIFLLRLNSW